MRRISSRATFFYKWMFPIFWFGFLAIFIAVPLITGSPSLPLPFLIMPVFMTIIGYFVMKKLVFDLVDEVLDAGDALIIRNRHMEERVALSDISNVSYSPLVSPPRVTLSLRSPGIFGKQVSFCAPIRFLPFSTNPVVDELIERIDAKRRGAR
jgi:hypothetical protein